MRFPVAHYGFLAMTAVMVAACSSDPTTAPSARAREIDRVSADLDGLTTTPTLYNQPETSYSLDNFAEAGNTHYLADDFIVPAGAEWTVAQVGIVGMLWQGSMTFAIREDDNGQPGAMVPNGEASGLPTILSSIPRPFVYNILYTLPSTPRLSAGKYWLVINTGAPDAGQQVGWQGHPQRNSVAVGSADGGATWQPRTLDYVFGVFGTSLLTQTITVAPLPTSASVGSTVVVEASASSGLTVTLSAGPSSTCTLSGTTVSFVGGGVCTIMAFQLGNPTYAPSLPETRLIMAVKTMQTIAFPPIEPNPADIGSSAMLAAWASSGLTVSFSSRTPNVCTVSGTTVSYDNAGTCTVAADQAGNALYDAAPRRTQSIEVGKKSQTITFTSAAPAAAYVNGTYAISTAGGASGNAVIVASSTPNVCSVTTNDVRFVGVGACMITANQAGSTGYDAATPVSQTIRVDYRFDGFLDPVKNGVVMNTAKAGQTVELKWRVTDANGAPVTTLALPRITADDLNCALGSTTDLLAERAAGASGLQNLGNGYYQYDWKSPSSYAKSCKTLRLDLGEGSGARTARFAFTK